MGHYIANLRDIQFCLFDLLEREKVMGTSLFSEIDKDTAIGMLEEIKRLAERELDERQYRQIIAKTISTLNETGSMEAVCFLSELHVS